MKNKNPTSFRLSQEAKELLEKLSNHLGISQADVLEILIREKSKKENIKL